MSRTILVNDILVFLQKMQIPYEYVGNGGLKISKFCSLNNPQSDSITWIKNATDTSLQLFDSQKNCLIVCSREVSTKIENVGFLLTENPKQLFFAILQEFWASPIQWNISGTSTILCDITSKKVSVGDNCYIGPEVYLGNNVIIEHNVTILNKVIVGDNCIIHSGAVIGSDGFGYYTNEDGTIGKVPHFGGVVIGADVEIGANACVDRGTLDDTIIGSGTKIDNLVHIAHNVHLGNNVLVIAGAIVCGSAYLDDGSYVAPGAIVKNQLHVGKNALVGMGAVVTQYVEDNVVVAGVPAKVIKKNDTSF